jgi:hypothetical protein
VDIRGSNRIELVQQLPVHEWELSLSPDGTLLAYLSGDIEQSEMILRTYPTQTGQWQVWSAGEATPCGARVAMLSTIAMCRDESCASRCAGIDRR